MTSPLQLKPLSLFRQWLILAQNLPPPTRLTCLSSPPTIMTSRRLGQVSEVGSQNEQAILTLSLRCTLRALATGNKSAGYAQRL